jgi:type II secretory pathway pseudopilin PulG
MSIKSKKRSDHGFSVAELVISIAILVIISTMVAVIFRSTQQSFVKAKAFQQMIDLARQTVMRMQNDLKATFIERTGMIHFVGIDASQAKIKPDSHADEIFFIVPLGGTMGGDICESGYWQRADGNIMRHVGSPPDFDFTTSSRDNELGVVVSELDFKYYDGSQYHDSWDSRIGGANEGKFPQAVRFSFYVSDEANVVKKKFESISRLASMGR